MAAMRWFQGGLIMMCLFALGHLAGFFQARWAARHDPRMADLTRAMREHRVNLLGFQPSILDLREYFSLNFSILVLLAAALGFAALSGGPAEAGTIRRLSVIYATAMLALMGTSIYFSVVQGFLGCLLIALLFGLSWWFA